MQPYSLHHDYPYQGQIDNGSSKKHLFLNIMLKFAFHRILHSDNGTDFKSKLIRNLSQQPSIKKPFIFPCHL